MNKETGKYFVDGSMEESKENIIKDEYEKEIVDFLTKSLHIAWSWQVHPFMYPIFDSWKTKKRL